jgi:hypothetical protein
MNAPVRGRVENAKNVVFLGGPFPHHRWKSAEGQLRGRPGLRVVFCRHFRSDHRP